MINIFKTVWARPFVRNVITLMCGAAGAQLIAAGFVPILTRIYGPDAFGLNGVFMSIVTLVATFGALTYQTAIVLPRCDGDAVGIVKLSILCAVVVSLLVTASLLATGKGMLGLVGASELESYAYLIPLMIFVTVLASVFGQWFVRKRAYKLSAGVSVYTSLITNCTKLLGGVILSPSPLVLVSTAVAGATLSLVLTLVVCIRSGASKVAVKANHSMSSLFKLAVDYRDFPLLRMPQNTINAVSQAMPVLLLSAYYSVEVAGQYSLAILALGVPVRLLGNSVAGVFYPRITDAVHRGENVKLMVIRGTLGLLSIGVVPFVVVIVLGPGLFSVVFGGEWSVSGNYAQWLAPWILLQLVNKPAVAAVAPLRLQGSLLVYEIFSTASKLMALWLGFFYFSNSYVSIAMFSVVGVLAYLYLIAWVIYSSPEGQSAEDRVIKMDVK